MNTTHDALRALQEFINQAAFPLSDPVAGRAHEAMRFLWGDAGAEELNPDHPVTGAMRGQWHKLAALLMHVLSPDHAVVITPSVIEAFARDRAGHAVVADEQKEGLIIRLVDRQEGDRLVARERERLNARKPPRLGGCDCYSKPPTVGTYRDRMTHLEDCPAYGSGLPVGATGPVTPLTPGLTADPADPEVVRATDHRGDLEPTPQHKKYLVLSEEERAKGYIRPVRRSYVHVGPPAPTYPTRALTAEEEARYEGMYVLFEPYPEGAHGSAIGRYWKQDQLDAAGKGCRTRTTMSDAIAETYARNPGFYGFTYCVGCGKHLPVADFTWDDGSRVGS